MGYLPGQEYLERYADVLVNFALGRGRGIRPGEVVLVAGPEVSKPLYVELCCAVWRAGGHVISDYEPDDHTIPRRMPEFYELATEQQLDFFPEHYFRGQVEQMDHFAVIIGAVDPYRLRDVPAESIMRHGQSYRRLVQWQQDKESAGRLTWTAALYGTEGMAAEAGLSLEEYWEQIISACFLGDPDPIGRWRQVTAQVQEHCARLNSLPIDRLHVEGEDVELWMTLGERRRWVGCDGSNIPSFEVFTSPDCRGTEGWIRFNQPLYAYGSLIRGVRLEFREGRVIAASAEEREDLLQRMIASDGGDRVGEFSLTDARLSPIRRFMAHTLYDENVGGPFGNMHIALGLSYRNCYDGDESTVSEDEWERLGFNSSAIHTDIISTADRTVTAVMRDGSERVIYAGGQFR